MIGALTLIFLGTIICIGIYIIMKDREEWRKARAEREHRGRLEALQAELDAAHENYTRTETARWKANPIVPINSRVCSEVDETL